MNTNQEYYFLIPNLLLYVDFKSLIKLSALSKKHFKIISGDENRSIGYWPAVCNSFCFHAGLYSPIIYNPELIYPIIYRKHFFDDLWPLRNKWTFTKDTTAEEVNNLTNVASTSATIQQSYKVKVACRFRPGELPQGKVFLPLHQFLKLKRQQKAAASATLEDGSSDTGSNNSSTHGILFGEKDPEEFLDPFLGTLMKDPVLLKPSGRICDRSVALQCILRGGRDPFNNKRLTQAMLEPLTELAQRIVEWKEKAEERKDIRVDIRDTKSLVDNQGVNNDLLEALLEIERIHRSLKKAKETDSQLQHQQEEMVVTEENQDNENPEQDEALEQQEQQPPENALENQENLFPNLLNTDDTNPFIDPFDDFLNDKKKNKKNEVARVVEVNKYQNYVSMHIPGSGIRPFHFSYVHDAKIKQVNLYETTIKESISSVLNGCNSCIMCYGQTGSGKTYTFLGPEGCLDDLIPISITPNTSTKSRVSSTIVAYDLLHYPSLGVVLRTTEDLFLAKKALTRYNISMTIGVQMIEVYEEKTTDLITGRPVTVRRETGSVNGPIITCNSQLEFIDYLRIAHSNQRYAETAMNIRSSRAHTVFVFHITQQHSSSSFSSQPLLLTSQLHLVDLAGSERIKKSLVTGIHLREAVGINSSLLVLGKVISSLVKGKSHIPYYESKLTTLLKSAFGGNARTTVIINTRMEEDFGDETLQTLRFGERCSMISNTLKQLASSYQDTLDILNQSLENMKKQIILFQNKKKTHLIAYQTLTESYSNLERKRNELLLLNQDHN
jgi:hypothetical protein